MSLREIQAQKNFSLLPIGVEEVAQDIAKVNPFVLKESKRITSGVQNDLSGSLISQEMLASPLNDRIVTNRYTNQSYSKRQNSDELTDSTFDYQDKNEYPVSFQDNEDLI